jgi:predicted  nucleic acid-binding Zn-ribbon protein
VQRDSRLAIQLQEAQSRITQLTAELAEEKQLNTQRLLAARRDQAAASSVRKSALLGKRTAEVQLQAATKRLRASEEMVVALQDAKACVACTVHLRCMAFVPCGHVSLCA